MDLTDAAYPSEEFFRALEARRTRALVDQDMPVLEALHAPQYQLITPSGKVFTRQAYLDAVAQAPFYSGWGIGEMSVRVSERMAIVRYQAHLRFPSSRELVCWHTDSYERVGEAWQAVWSQATEIKA